MRCFWAILAVSLWACSSPSGGGSTGAVTADVKGDGLLTTGDTKTDGDLATADSTEPDAIELDATDDASTDGIDALDDIATDSADIQGFFDDTSDDVNIVCGDSGLVKGVACAPKAGASVAFATVSIDINTPVYIG